MNTKTRQQFIQSQSGEKLTLARVNARSRLYTFTGPTDDVYTKNVPYFVSAVSNGSTVLDQVAAAGDIVEDTWHYDVETGVLSLRLGGDIAPNTVDLIVTYSFFYSTKAVQLPHTLTTVGQDVHWDGRITSSPGYKSKVGIDQSLISLAGEGVLKLQNSDGALDDIYDKYIFENQAVTIYSWSPELAPGDARVIYRGTVQNKQYTTNEISLRIKDQIFNLLESPSLSAYSNSGTYFSTPTAGVNIATSAQGQIVRRVYGRVDGLKCQSIDMQADGVLMARTASMETESNQLVFATTNKYASAPQPSTTLIQGDKLTVGTQEFTVSSAAFVGPNFVVTTEQATDFPFQGIDVKLQRERGGTFANTYYSATGHQCTTLNKTVERVEQLNRLKLNNTEGLFPGDFVDVFYLISTAERLEISRIAPNGVIVLRKNMVNRPPVGAIVQRSPIQQVFIDGLRVPRENYEISNSANGCGIRFINNPSKAITRDNITPFDCTFTNNSRTISVASSDVPLSEIFAPGDYIRPNASGYTVDYEIRSVGETTLTLINLFAQSTITEVASYSSPNFIKDSTVVSVDILGKEDVGKWHRTVPDVLLDLVGDIGITEIDAASFASGAIITPSEVSLCIPQDFTAKTIPNVKTIADALNISVRGALTLNNDLQLAYRPLTVFTGANLSLISDKDAISWSIDASNGKTYKNVLTNYNFTDVNLSTLSPGSDFYGVESPFVTNYIGTNKAFDLELKLSSEPDAKVYSSRFLYYNRLGVATIKVTTDLRFENLQIGDAVKVDFRRLYNRLGGATRLKVVMVVGKQVDGNRVILELSDLGNTFNASSFITPNDAVSYDAASEDDKLIYGYITDNQGIVDNNENTANTNLIS